MALSKIFLTETQPWHLPRMADALFWWQCTLQWRESTKVSYSTFTTTTKHLSMTLHPAWPFLTGTFELPVNFFNVLLPQDLIIFAWICPKAATNLAVKKKNGKKISEREHKNSVECKIEGAVKKDYLIIITHGAHGCYYCWRSKNVYVMTP